MFRPLSPPPLVDLGRACVVTAAEFVRRFDMGLPVEPIRFEATFLEVAR